MECGAPGKRSGYGAWAPPALPTKTAGVSPGPVGVSSLAPLPPHHAPARISVLGWLADSCFRLGPATRAPSMATRRAGLPGRPMLSSGCVSAGPRRAGATRATVTPPVPSLLLGERGGLEWQTHHHPGQRGKEGSGPQVPLVWPLPVTGPCGCLWPEVPQRLVQPWGWRPSGGLPPR